MPAEGQLTLRLFMGSLFLISGYSKARDISSFLRGLDEYRVVTSEQARVLAYLIPFLELLIGVLCISGFLLSFAAFGSLLLTIVFTVAVLINIGRGRSISCHCFGKSSASISPLTLVRNFLLMGVSTFLLILSLSVSATPFLQNWHRDFIILSHGETGAPVIAIVLLLLGTLLLVDEVDLTVLHPKSSRTRET